MSGGENLFKCLISKDQVGKANFLELLSVKEVVARQNKDKSNIAYGSGL